MLSFHRILSWLKAKLKITLDQNDPTDPCTHQACSPAPSITLSAALPPLSTALAVVCNGPPAPPTARQTTLKSTSLLKAFRPRKLAKAI